MRFRRRIPVTIIGGFLGSGKTTLVNYLIQYGGKRFGVVVNEFGDLGVDGALIQRLEGDGSGEIMELAGGCLCCVGREDLVRALVLLARAPNPPEYVLIELSGLADPVPVLQTLLDPEVRAVFETDGLITVVDARNFFATLEQNSETALQLAYCNTVVLNKADLADTELLEDVENAVQQLSPLAQVVITTRSSAPLEKLLNLRAFDPEFEDKTRAHEHAHTQGVSSFSLHADAPLDLVAWQWFLQDLILSKPTEVLRVKGWLSLEGIPEKVLFQAVRDIFTAEATTQKSDGRSSIVVIGRNLDEGEYRSRFADAVKKVVPVLTRHSVLPNS